MANLNEESIWTEGIYQLEKDDPVEAGPDGIDNLQAKQLANRTVFLKDLLVAIQEIVSNQSSSIEKIPDITLDLTQKAPLDSPVFTGTPEVNEPTGKNKNQIVNVAYLETMLAESLIRFAQQNPKSLDEIRSLLAQMDNNTVIDDILSTLSGLADKVSNLGSDDELWLAQAVTDVNGQVAYGVTHRGDFYQPSATVRNEESFPGFAVTDSRDRLLFGFNAPKSEMLLPGATMRLSDGDNIAYAITDNLGKTALTIDTNGVLTCFSGIQDSSGMAYIKQGDVYHQKGSVTTQITHRGDVVACQMYGDAVRYVAPRRGVYLTYEWKNGAIKQVLSDSLIDGYIVTGQSLAEGGANAAISKTPINNAYTLDTGPVPNARRAAGSRVINLSEQVFETISSGFAQQTLATNSSKPIMIHGSAIGGMSYAKLKKGGESGVYEKIIQQIQTLGRTAFLPTYRAIFVIHGEADGNLGTKNYDDNLSEWLQDFTQDIMQLTGQQEAPILITCQTSSVSGYKRTAETRHDFTTPFLQLAVSQSHPRIFLACPKYQFNYKDYAHILAKDTQLLGEYYAKVKRSVIDKGEDWLGLRPKQLIKLDEKRIKIEFYVPKPPLVLDTTLVSNPSNYGFVLKDGNTVLSIASVDLVQEENAVIITAAENIPDGSIVTYAFDNGVFGKSGRLEGARGNLRDSDDTLATNGQDYLHNWCFAFKLSI